MKEIMLESWRCPCLELDSYATEISIISDEIASYLGHMLSVYEFEPVTKELLITCLKYNMEIMDVISRTDIISSKDIQWIKEEYIKLRSSVETPKGYTLPMGSPASTFMQIVRAKTRTLARYVFLWMKKENIDCELLLEFINMQSNIYYFLALDFNEQDEIENQLYKSFSK